MTAAVHDVKAEVNHAFRVYIENLLSDLDRKIEDVEVEATKGTAYSQYKVLAKLASEVGDEITSNKYITSRDIVKNNSLLKLGWIAWYSRLRAIRATIVDTLEFLDDD